MKQMSNLSSFNEGDFHEIPTFEGDKPKKVSEEEYGL